MQAGWSGMGWLSGGLAASGGMCFDADEATHLAAAAAFAAHTPPVQPVEVVQPYHPLLRQGNLVHPTLHDMICAHRLAELDQQITELALMVPAKALKRQADWFLDAKGVTAEHTVMPHALLREHVQEELEIQSGCVPSLSNTQTALGSPVEIRHLNESHCLAAAPLNTAAKAHHLLFYPCSSAHGGLSATVCSVDSAGRVGLHPQLHATGSSDARITAITVSRPGALMGCDVSTSTSLPPLAVVTVARSSSVDLHFIDLDHVSRLVDEAEAIGGEEDTLHPAASSHQAPSLTDLIASSTRIAADNVKILDAVGSPHVLHNGFVATAAHCTLFDCQRPDLPAQSCSLPERLNISYNNPWRRLLPRHHPRQACLWHPHGAVIVDWRSRRPSAHVTAKLLEMECRSLNDQRFPSHVTAATWCQHQHQTLVATGRHLHVFDDRNLRRSVLSIRSDILGGLHDLAAVQVDDVNTLAVVGLASDGRASYVWDVRRRRFVSGGLQCVALQCRQPAAPLHDNDSSNQLSITSKSLPAALQPLSGLALLQPLFDVGSRAPVLPAVFVSRSGHLFTASCTLADTGLSPTTAEDKQEAVAQSARAWDAWAEKYDHGLQQWRHSTGPVLMDEHAMQESHNFKILDMTRVLRLGVQGEDGRERRFAAVRRWCRNYLDNQPREEVRPSTERLPVPPGPPSSWLSGYTARQLALMAPSAEGAVLLLETLATHPDISVQRQVVSSMEVADAQDRLWFLPRNSVVVDGPTLAQVGVELGAAPAEKLQRLMQDWDTHQGDTVGSAAAAAAAAVATPAPASSYIGPAVEPGTPRAATTGSKRARLAAGAAKASRSPSSPRTLLGSSPLARSTAAAAAAGAAVRSAGAAAMAASQRSDPESVMAAKRRQWLQQ